MTTSSKLPSRFIPSEEIGEGAVRQWQFHDVAHLETGLAPLLPLGGTTLEPLIRPALPTTREADAMPDDAEGAAAEAAPGISEEELQQRLAQAREEGYAQGLEEGREQGMAQGAQQAREEAQQQQQELQQQWQQRLDDFQSNVGAPAAQSLSAMLEEAGRGIRDLQERMAPDLLQLACDIARQVVRQELRCNPQALLPVVREALDMLNAETRPATVRLNPEDWTHLEPHLRAAIPGPNVQWLPDAGVARGGCRVESAGAQVNGGLQRRWQRAVAALGLVSTWYEGDTPSAGANTGTEVAHG